MPLVVHVEPVVDGVVLEVGDEAGDVDDGHRATSLPRRAGYGGPAVDGDLLPVSMLGSIALLDATAVCGDGRTRRCRPTGGSLAAVRTQASTAATSPPTRPRSACCSTGRRRRAVARRAVCHGPIATSSWSSTRSTARRTRSTGSPGSRRASAPSTPRGRAAALVVNLATGERFEAVRGGGATRNGEPISPSSATPRSARRSSGCRGYPPRRLGWKQYRALGAVALDLCAVACGRARRATSTAAANAHGPWDYLGGMLVCLEAGAVVIDAFDRDLVVLDHDAAAHARRRCHTGAARREPRGRGVLST